MCLQQMIQNFKQGLEIYPQPRMKWRQKLLFWSRFHNTPDPVSANFRSASSDPVPTDLRSLTTQLISLYQLMSLLHRLMILDMQTFKVLVLKYKKNSDTSAYGSNVTNKIYEEKNSFYNFYILFFLFVCWEFIKCNSS